MKLLRNSKLRVLKWLVLFVMSQMQNKERISLRRQFRWKINPWVAFPLHTYAMFPGLPFTVLSLNIILIVYNSYTLILRPFSELEFRKSYCLNREKANGFLFQKYGKIDVVVSNAAANPSVESILQTQESVLDKLWEINVKASILLLKVPFFIILEFCIRYCRMP